MAKVFIIEDNKDQLIALKHKVELLGHEIVGISLRADNVFSELESTHPEVVLLDINFNNDNEGLILAERINEYLSSSIIFTTALSSKSIIRQAIQTNPSGYLTKPISINDLKAGIELAVHQNVHEAQRSKPSNDVAINENYLTVRTGFKLQKINYNDIKFLKTDSKNYIILTTCKGKKVVVRNSLKSMCDTVLPPFFIQIHRQYVVNLNFITLIDEREQMLHIDNNIHLPIGRAYKKKLYIKLNLV